MKNNLYTLSYFRKRLNEGSIKSIRLINNYSKDDNRYWTILIDPTKKNILCTCYKSEDKFYFSLHTDKYFNYEIHTLSMDVVVEVVKSIIDGCEKS